MEVRAFSSLQAEERRSAREGAREDAAAERDELARLVITSARCLPRVLVGMGLPAPPASPPLPYEDVELPVSHSAYNGRAFTQS